MSARRPRNPAPLQAKAVSLAVAACFSVAVETAIANPTGGTVVSGSALFNRQGNQLTVTNTPGAIINWQGFSIAQSEVTRFIQQSAASSVLNRVVGADPSVVLGALQSNGRVFLINPNGIVFGAGAQIDVAGLVASSLNLSNADFLAGRLRFTDTPGAGLVNNQGAITTPSGGQVYLIAPDVKNSGIITSPQGEVILAAGRSVEIVDAGTPTLRVEITAPDTQAVNVGQIVANSGRIGIYAGLIRNSGVIKADGIVIGKNGEILLKATNNVTLDPDSVISASGPQGGNITIQSGDTTLVSGTLQATGSAGTGGTVQLLGNLVGVVDNAVVDASGLAGGGTVLIGGDYQGRNPDVQNAFRTYVGPSASINADALANGDGGKVIVWSDDATRVYGSISARGGAQSGNGGFVETSGHRLDVTRGPDVTAPRGAAGTWLLDPVDLNVVAGSTLVNNTSAPFFDPLAESSSIGVNLINQQLDFGSNVVLTTTSQGSADGAQAGNITISAPILKQAATTTGPGGVFIGTTSLTLQAHNNIVIDGAGSITSTGDPLNVTLIGNSDNVGGGGVTINGAIATRGGFASVQGRDLIAVNAPINTLSSTGTGGGSVSLTSSAGPVTGAAPVTGGFFSGNAGGGAMTLAANVTSTGMSLTGRNGVSVAAGTAVNAGANSFTATVTDPASAASLDIGAGSQITSSGATLISDNMDIQGAINAGAGNVTLRQNSVGRQLDLGTNTVGKLSLTQAVFDRIAVTGSLNIGDSNTGAITVSAPLTATLPGAVNVNGASITQNAPVNVSGSLTVTTDNVTISSTLTVGGNVTFLQRSFFRPVNLGAAADSGTAIDFSAAELNSIVTPASLRIGNFSTGAVTIVNPIAPANVGALALTSGSQITQSARATINVANLKLSTSGSVSLPEANSVGTLAGSASGFGGGFSFANAAGTPLTIGSVDGTTGVSFNNSNGTINLLADNLTVASPISANFSNGAVVIQPVLAATKLDLGGADAAGTLGISAAELAKISATTLTLKADQADISAPVAAAASTLVIAPRTSGRALNVVGGAKNAANLEFLPAELNNVSANSLVLGDPNTGPVTVNAATTIPASIGTFTLRSGDTVTGITLNTDDTISLSATGNLAFFADTMNVNASVTSTSGDITIAPNTAGRAINLGSKPAGTLGLNASELGQFAAPSGTLIVGNSSAGGVTISGPVAFSGIGALNLTSGGTITVSGALTTPGNLFLTASDMAIGAAVTASGPSGDINVAPVGFGGTVTLGGAGGGLNLSAAELNFFAPGSGVLRIGDISTTGNIQITGAISPANATTLSLRAGSGSVTQSPLATITIPNLAVDGGNGITLNEHNDADTVALRSTSGSVAFTYSGSIANPLTIGDVDNLSGVQSNFGNVTLRTDELNINSPVFAGSSVSIIPLSPGRRIDLGTKSPGNWLGLTAGEIGLIAGSSATFGDSTSGNLTVSAPISIFGISDVTLNTGATAAVNGALSVPGNLGINAGFIVAPGTGNPGTINTTAALTSSFGSINLVADSMTFGAPVSAPSGTIVLRPLNAIAMDLGGMDVPAVPSISLAVLGLNPTDLAALSAAALAFGSNTTSSITVSAGTNLGATPTTLTTAGGGTGTINVNAALTSGNLALNTDNLVIPVAGSVTAPNVTLNTLTGGRTVDLGTAVTGTALGLDQATLNRITTPGTFTVNNAGLINVSAPVSFTNEANLTLHGDTMTIGSTVTSPGGGRITVAPRNSRAMDLGGADSGSVLGLTSAEINNFVTTGVLQLGDTTASSINISQAIAPLGASTVTLFAGSSGISQTAPITQANLRIQTSGQANLTQNNSVANLAGSSSGNFSFTNSGTLTIGAVDGASGVSDSTVSIKSDGLTVSQQIAGGNVTLAPRNAGAPIDLGSKPAGVFGVTDAELDLISASNLFFGNSTAGPVTVSSAMSRGAGTFNIVTGTAQSISVNAGLSGQSNVSMTGGSINISAPVSSTLGSVTLTALDPTTLNVNAAVTARNSVQMTSDVINLGAPVTSTSGSVTLRPNTSNRPISLGTENPAALSLTPAEINLITASSLTVGSTSAGPLTVTAPIAPTGVTNLTLQSGGAITQSPGAAIVTRKVVNNVVQGTLGVVALGNVNLREANDVGTFLSGSTSGVKQDFDFNNVGPLKVQQVSVSVSGKRRINSAFFVPSISGPEFDDSVLSAINTAIAAVDQSTQMPFDKDKKNDEKTEKKDGKQVTKGLREQCE
jgi:filamentous hemagglutinin family protein